MKQRYVISKSKNTGSLTIQEFAELDKDLFSLTCEESYDAKTIANVIKEGKKAIIAAIRTPNMYPIAEYIDRIADVVMEIYQKGDEQVQTREIEFDDSTFMKKWGGRPAEREEAIEIEDLLEEDEVEDVDAEINEPDVDDPLDVPDTELE